MKQLILIAFIALTAMSCKTSKSTAQAKKLGDKACECMNPLVQLMDEMKKAEASGDMTKVMEIAQKAENMSKCAEELSKEGEAMEKGMNEEQKKKFGDDMKAAMKKKCPKVVEIMETEN